MADVKWIKIVTDIFDNRKIRIIENMPDGDAIIVIWFKLICLAGVVNDRGMIYVTDEVPYTDEMLSVQFNKPINTIRLALSLFQKYDMIEVIDDMLRISSWERYQNIDGMEKIKEQTRRRVEKYRKAKKEMAQLQGGNVTSNVTVTQCNETDIDIDKNKIREDKEKKKEKNTLFDSENQTIKSSPKKEANELFERLWKLYPLKRGKGQVSDSVKKQIVTIGEKDMIRAIERYKKDLERDCWRKAQNGSTFFRSGYIDYLDCNYSTETKTKYPEPEPEEEEDEEVRPPECYQDESGIWHWDLVPRDYGKSK